MGKQIGKYFTKIQKAESINPVDYYAILNTLSANVRRESNQFYEPLGKIGI